MSILQFDRRLRKLEASSNGRSGGLFYIVWATSSAGLDGAVATEIASGRLTKGDMVVRLVWPVATGIPTNRWIQADGFPFNHAEFGCIAEHVDTYRDEFVRKVYGLTRVDKAFDDDGDSGDCRRDWPEFLRTMPDAQMVAAILGQRIGSSRPCPSTLPDQTKDRIGWCIIGIDQRAIIRGCYDVIEKLRDEAA